MSPIFPSKTTKLSCIPKWGFEAFQWASKKAPLDLLLDRIAHFNYCLQIIQHTEFCHNQTFMVLHAYRPRPVVIQPFSCSTQLSMNFFMLINLKLLTMTNSFLLNIAEHENFSANILINMKMPLAFSYLLAEKISCSAKLSMKKVLSPRGQTDQSSVYHSLPGTLELLTILVLKFEKVHFTTCWCV